MYKIVWFGTLNKSIGYIGKKKTRLLSPCEKICLNTARKTVQRCDKNYSPPKLSRIKNFYTYSIVLGSLFSIVMWAIYKLGKPEEDHRGPIEDEFSQLPWFRQYIMRMWHTLQYYEKMMEEPQMAKLLPNVVPPPYIQPPYSLVLEIKDVLVHPDWTYQTGWRFKKRPGVDYFLQQCSRNFEIVIYTSEQGMTAFPLLDALDPYGYISYRLVRGATDLVEGQHTKNLDYLNRDLSRVIVVDCDPYTTPMHPDNSLVLTKWLGNDDDVQLFDLTAFLQLVAEHQVNDVREVLRYYRQFEDPIEQFKDNQRRLQEQNQESIQNLPTSERQWNLTLLGRSLRGSSIK
ncbi:mitochondrial import inner membrane translocase subunit TIM50-A isoform X1 [Drosophila mauritiana]|uniref:Mitochondrial import inner membrane translocase subunit TIM50 n=1 Tax=Drosophila mauritiana TaxID=7226 RepID=A0A6P8KL57_DROMA|nr:mitochondrial import inner membrane translocase subunit TIM50-A isoform X1 [Drosophila mauritiana]